MSLKNTFLIKEDPKQLSSQRGLEVVTHLGQVERIFGKLMNRLRREDLPRDQAASMVRQAAQEIDGELEAYAQFILGNWRGHK
jgi:hypothetical protein